MKNLFSGIVKSIFRNNTKSPKGDSLVSERDKAAIRKNGSRLGLPLALFTLLMGSGTTAFAGTYACGPASEGGDFQVLDGYNLPGGMTLAEFENLSSLSFVGDCTIKNFPFDNGITGFGSGSTLLNFNLPDKVTGATIVMDDVWYNGNMSCSNLPPSVVIWWVNGAWNSIDDKCQDFLPPELDGLRKLNPGSETTQSIGVPFTYTLTASEMVEISYADGSYSWVADTAPGTDSSGPDDLTYVRIEDDLTAHGADLSYVSYNAYLVDGLTGAYVSPFTFDIAPTPGQTNLVFQSSNPTDPGVVVPANHKLVVELTVVLDDTAANTPGTSFTNEVDWYLSKTVTNTGGVDRRIENVPGHTEATDPMTIVGPYLQVSKTSPETTLSAGESAPFTVDVYNSGQFEAWDPVIVDHLPAGMCFNDPTPSLTVEHVDTVGTSVALDPANYTLTWDGGTETNPCEIRLTTTDLKLAPQEHLVINYDAVLDTAPLSGELFTNVASADTWYNADSTITTRKVYSEPATDGTTGDNTDSEDAHTITAAAPYLQVTKDSTVSTLNVGPAAPYTIDVYNTADGSAWDPVIGDYLPAGMCQYDATQNLTAQLFDTDGTTPLGPELVEGTDYTLSWTGGDLDLATPCQFTLTTTDVEIGPQQHLIISYDAKLESGVTSGQAYTNVASADTWYNAASTVGTRTTYNEPASDGTIADGTDSEDAYSVTAAVAGYYFLKSVDNLTTGVSGATTALPGDTLRYTLSLQNFTQPTLSVSALSDQLPAELDYSTFSFVSSSFPVAYDWDSATGIISFPTSFDLADTQSFEIQFEITLYPDLADGVSVDNFAKLSGTYNSGADTLTDALSDDPNDADGPVELISSTLDPADPDYSARNDTSVTIITPGALSKLESKPEVTIGDSFTYTITVPQTTVGVGLYDVKVVDDFAATGMVLTTTASATLASGTQSWTNLSVAYDAGLGAYVIQDTAGGGIDIPPGDQAIITVNATLDNDEINQSDLATSANSAYYTYNKRNGIATNTGEGAAGTSGLVSVVEPDLTVDKLVSNVTAPGEPAQTGQTLRYTVDILNGGSSEAFDVNIADTLPANLLLDDTSVTATIVGVGAVAGFNPVPSTINGAKVWGNQNGDDTLDIGVGETLRLTYEVFVLSTDGTPLVNSVYVDWTSLDGVQTDERTGDGCPTLTAPALNDYCSAEAFATIQTTDTNSIVKTILGDSNPDPSDPPVLRVGDTVTYQLAVQLHEGTTPNVVVEDTLPAGMQLDADPTYNTSAGATFSYTLTTSPATSDSGTLVWDFGDVDNQSATLGLDEILIEYTAVVVTDPAPTGVDHVPSLTDPDTTNHATLAYTGGDPTSADPAVYDRLNSEALLDIHQPIMTPISKVDYGTGRTGLGTAGEPYQVDIVNDTMNFRLQTCNDTGLAPAYNLAIRDTLPAEMDVTSIVGPVVKVGADLGSAVAVTEGAANDYVYTLNGSVMDFVFTDNRPIAPNECVFVEYDIGFDAGSITPTTPDWFNTAEVVNYWSLPTSSGREYTPTDSASVYMTNAATLLPPTKAITQPAFPTDSTVTIGEQVIYTITIPAVNANLTNVLVEDTLDGALLYTVGDATVSGGLSFSDNSSGQLFRITIDSIPAGQDVVITLPVQVADNGTAIAGYSFDNQADYTYNGTTYTSALTGTLTIVEPQLVPTKDVTPTTDPVAGDTLTYTLTIPAQTATNTSQAFDLTVVDTLGDGLNYVGGTAQFNGMSPGTTEPTLGTSGTQQTLTWAGLDIPYNTEVTITYDVQVQDSVVPYQTLTNTADFEWTSLDTPVAGERTYTASDSTTLTVADTASLTKAVVADSYADATLVPVTDATDGIVRVGDTVDYQLTLNLQEGTTELVTVTDDLPTGLAYDSLVSVVAGTGITHDPVNVTVDGTTGDVTFELGNVVHTPDADADDAIVITYRVRVLKDLLAHQASISPITNTATLAYTGSVAGNTNLQNSAEITVLQPVIPETSLTKEDRYGLSSTAQIDDVANTTMGFTLHACNEGAAPAYNMEIWDDLDTQYFDETSINILEVRVAGTPTTNYTYTYLSPRMTFAVDEPVYPTQCIDIDFDIGFRTDFGADQSWENTFQVREYWSLPQPDGNAQLYAPVVLLTPFVMTNNVNATPPTKQLLSPLSPAEATIGEEVVYEIHVPGAVNTTSALYDVVINDPLDGNLEYVSATVTGLSGSTVTDTSSGSSMDITIDQIPAGEQAIIELHARVRNVLSAQDTAAIDNTVSYTYAKVDGGPAESAQSSSQLVTVNIVEPDIGTITKQADKTSATAGETVRYSVELTAASGPDASDVFDVVLTDTLDEGLAYAGTPDVTVGGGVGADNTIGAPTITGDGSTGNPQTLVWDLSNSDIDIAEGETVTISYDVRVLDNVLANQTLSNHVVAQWTGRDGAHTTATDYERDGSDGATGLNDYITAEVFAPITTPDTNAITKTWTGDTYADGAANVRIGDTVDYTLTLSIQEGTLNNLEIVDTLPQGLEFAGIVSINGDNAADYTQVAPFTHAPITAADVVASPGASTGPTTVTWSLGTVTNTQNDGTNDDFVIVYRARVLNNVFAHTDLTLPLSNTAEMRYDTATGQVIQSGSASITALQPQLTVSKIAAAANGDPVVDGGEVVTYTVDIVNNGTAPAYDVVLQDTIPAGMRVDGVTPVNTYLVSSPQAAPGMSFAPTYDPVTGIAIWNFDDGVTPSAYTIPVGDTLRVIYSVTVDANVAAGITLTNTAQATNYYSLNDDVASPTNSSTAREEYASNTAQTTVSTAIGDVLSKTAGQPSAGIGEEFTYTISVPSAANPSTTALNDVVVYDNLSVGGADLEFVQADVLAGSDWSGTLVGTINASGILEITTSDPGGIDIPAGGHLEMSITVRLLDTANNNTAGLTFTNRAWYTYFNGTTTLGSDATTGATSDSMTVAHPDLTMTKTGPSPATMRIGTPASFSLDVQNTGTSDAWDVTVTDWLPNPVPGGMCDAGVTNVSATIYESDGSTVVQTLAAGDYVTSFTVSATEPRCEFVLTTIGVSIAPTERLIVTYDIALDADSIDGSTLTNIAGATQWLSADPAGGVYHTYTEALTNGTVGTPDHEDAYTVTVEGAVLTAEKSVYNVTTSQSGANASPGDQLRYTITVQNTTDIPMSNFSLVDALDSLNATQMFQAGSISNVTVPAGATFSITGNTLNVDGLNIAANGSLTVTFDAVLVPVIDSGTVVYNQGQLSLGGTVIANTDDLSIVGTEDPTETLIASAPEFEVWKTSEDITGDPAVLVPGDTLRYTITVQNIGDEDAVNAVLRDQIPAYTTYVANSTTLNGNAVADPSAGVSPLQDGMQINAPEDTTAGVMHAAAAGTTDHIATITFDVVVDSSVADGTVISNQGLVNAEGAGTSGSAPEAVSDDPDTTTVDDPTRDVVGALPLVDSQKTVEISNDLGSIGVVDPGDELLYTITVTNSGGLPATGVVLTDATPANTTYVANSVTLNGIAVGNPDGGVSPLATGIDISSADLTPPLPAAGAGTLSPGGTATVTFKVTVNNDGSVGTGDIISNQGVVQTNESADEPTDADGIDSNGDQPTEVVVGPAQQLSISKSMVVVGGGSTVEAGDDIEYVITVTNIGSLPANDVVITDNLDLPVAGQLTYVPGFTFLNGSTSGTDFTSPVVSGDYGTTYGPLPVGESAVLRFRATVNASLPIGTLVENTGVVEWNAASQNNSDTISFPVGGSVDSAVISGQAWRDINNNQTQDGSEPPLAGWTVEVYRDSTLIATVVTDADGNYTVNGLVPNDTSAVEYSVTFTAPGATATTAPLGVTDSGFTDGLQTIDQITVSAGTVNQDLNLPLLPNGVVYNSMLRTPIAGATLTMLDAASGQALPASCFDDAAQQNQVTPADGYYRFDPNFSDPACTAGGEYLIQVTPPSTAYETGTSQVIPPQSDSTTVSFSVPACIGSADDTVPATAEICEAVTLDSAPPTTVDAQTAGTNYYLHLLLDQNTGPVDNLTFNNQLFNNHIPLDPVLNNVVSITKTAARVNVSRGEMVPYTITVESDYFTTLLDLSIVDNFPAGFKYVEGSGRFDGEKLEPTVNGNQLRWNNVDLVPDERHTIQLLLIVGSGVSEAEYVNRAHVENTFSGAILSQEATATVRVVPDPTFDCTDVIGKVFDDKNLNGVQDDGEKGLPGARVVTARGLIVTADEHGRFHVTCAMVPDEVRGSNFILKLDDRSLPTGYRVTTENPRVQRATRGKMLKFNFGATIHRVVRLDVADAVYEPDTATMRSQWQPRIGMLLEELQKGPSVLRISYLADVEDAGLVRKRVAALKEMINTKWDDLSCCYELTIETEVYWRRGGPPKRRDIID